MNDITPAAMNRTAAARYAGCSPDEVARAKNRGDLPVRYLGTKPMFLRGDLDAWIASWPSEPARRSK